MFLFLLGVTVGAMLGIALIARLSTGAVADERIELLSEKFDQFSLEKQEIIISKH